MSSAPSNNPSASLTRQQALNELWDEHVRDEFVLRNADATLTTMVDDAYVNHVPVMTGGAGKGELRAFYGQHFIPDMPADAEVVPVSRTIAADRLWTS
jgi:carboxymethylenebutenolidase